MVNLRARVFALSSWRSEWHADTLFGSLCWIYSQLDGVEQLRHRLLEPSLGGNPPFVISDAMPAGLFPLPLWCRAELESQGLPSKAIKRSRWVSADTFAACLGGNCPGEADLRPSPLTSAVTLHNTPDRDTGGPSGDGGLFESSEKSISAPGGSLEIMAKVAEDFIDEFQECFEILGQTGFGADAGTGRGHFRVEFEQGSWAFPAMDAKGCNGLVGLSTFQPKAGDSTDGMWEICVKRGRLGSGLGLENDETHKLPAIFLAPGACFFSATLPDFMGRAIPADQILLPAAIAKLKPKGIEPIHGAFGLALAAIIPTKWGRRPL